jgi:hypothetical protein
MAMMHLAVHDALNSINRRFEAYLYEGKAEPSAAPGAAVAAAARDVLVGVIPAWGKPEQRAKALAIVDGAYTAALGKVPDGLPKKHGISVGQAAAAAMLAARKLDGSSASSQYTPGTAPGKWRPHPNPVPANPPIADAALAVGNWPALLPQWGNVAPFTMATPWQFRLPGRPALASAQYAVDYEEVKRLGGKNSPARTAEQSEIARYWYEGSPQGWSRIARVVAAQRGLDRWDNARLLALMNAVIADGFVAGFDTRYPNFRSFGSAREYFQGLGVQVWHYIWRAPVGMRNRSGRRRPSRWSSAAWRGRDAPRSAGAARVAGRSPSAVRRRCCGWR